MITTQPSNHHSSITAAVALAIPVLSLMLPSSLQAASQKFTSSGTFTPPAGITSVTVECWGGGGAGGGAQRTTANSGGGGGGGGAYARKLNVPVTPGTPYPVTIPAGVTCPASGWTNGQTYDGAEVTFTGDGSVSVTVNTFTGAVTVNGGNLTLSHANPLPNISGLTIGGATLGCSSGNATIAAPITLTGNLTVKVQNSGVLANLNGALDGTGNLVFSTGDNTLSGDNRVSLGAAGSFVGNVTITTTGLTTANNMTVRLAAVNALPTTAVVTLDGQNGNGTSWTDLNLFGFDQTLAGLKNVTRTSRLQRVYNGGSEAATLTINNTVDYSFGGKLGKASGDNFGLTKGGSGMFTLSGASTYTGATTVTAGTLALGVSHALADTTAVAIGNATLAVGAGFTDTVGTLDATGTATIHLGTGATLVFADSSAVAWSGGLNLTGSFVSGNPGSLRFGTTNTGLTTSQLAGISATGFSGFGLDADGFLTATATGGYAAWQTANSTSQPIDQDHDNDGVDNGIEYFLGGSTSTTGLTPLPGVIPAAGTLSVTWTKAASDTGTYGRASSWKAHRPSPAGGRPRSWETR